jgi:carbon storage regulator
MLVLTRHENEGLILQGKDGLEIHIVVLGVQRNKVSLGIKAPREIDIWRDEIAPEAPTGQKELEEEKKILDPQSC